jgi:hypothetical protein
MRKLAIAASLVAAVLVGQTANAALITSIDRATFQAAVAGGTISSQNFDSLAVGTLLGTVNGVTYGASGGTPIVTNSFLTSTSPNGLGSTSVGFFTATESATFSFATGITAFAIDINTFATANGSYRALLSTGDTANSLFETFTGFATGQFLGFVSDTAFTSVRISALTGFPYTLDTLVYGDARAVSQVPEPTSAFLLLGGGVLLLAFRQKRRQNV